MRAAHLFTLTLACALTLPATVGFGPARHATILSEVQKHLDEAHEGMSNGTPEVAVAHANLVLVGDEVRYSVEFVGIADRLHAKCTKALEGAIDKWEKALDDTVTFREVTDPATADVVVRFKQGVFMGSEPVAGYANWKRTFKADGPHVQSVSFKADLQIRTVNLDGQSMPFECVRHEIAHEVGHVLGLEDSDTTGDLMGPLDVNHPVSGPQSYEAEAVRQLRSDARRVRTDALAKVQG
jgi:hypothetical protein